jgi:hypothetical protein
MLCSHLRSEYIIANMQRTFSPAFCLAIVLVGFAIAVPARGGSMVAPHVLPKQTGVAAVSLIGVRPQYTTLRELVSNPGKFDGQLVQFRAWPAIGWEGDNFLFENAYQPGMITSGVPMVWFYVSRQDSEKLFESISSMKESGGYFRGYFHYVSDSKSNGLFNPGPLQFDVKEVSKMR